MAEIRILKVREAEERRKNLIIAAFESTSKLDLDHDKTAPGLFSTFSINPDAKPPSIKEDKFGSRSL